MKLIRKQFVFPFDRYFRSSHASTLIKNSDGTFAAACFGGDYEGERNVRIQTAFLDSEWNVKSYNTIEQSDCPHWNPVMYVRGDGEVLLWFKTAERIKDWKTYRVSSHNGGYSWENEITKVDIDGMTGARGPVKNKPYRTKSGLLIAPRSVETETDWTVIPEYSYDDGYTWNECEPLEYEESERMLDGYRNRKPNGVIQPTVYEYGGMIHMLMRSTWGRVWISDSSDGIHWSEAKETGLPNNNSGIDCVCVNDRIYLAHNPVSENWGARTPLVISDVTDMLYDTEKTGEKTVLEDKPGEYSYPAVIADGNRIYCTYTWNRRNIVICEIEI